VAAEDISPSVYDDCLNPHIAELGRDHTMKLPLSYDDDDPDFCVDLAAAFCCIGPHLCH